MSSIKFSENIASSNRFFVDRIEYPCSSYFAILDTLDVSKYTLEVSLDTLEQKIIVNFDLIK